MAQAATFICGMPTPWPTVPFGWQWPTTYVNVPDVVRTNIYEKPACDHCFCKEFREHAGDGVHLKCCKCGTFMAEKFVKAWMKILTDMFETD